MKDRVLAFFGAFNPPTIAHVELAKLALDETGCKQLFFVPSQKFYVTEEQKKDYCFEDYERLEMIYAACRDDNRLNYITYDINAEVQPRTYDTLCWMRDEMKVDPVLLVGMDQFLNMKTGWKHVPEIAKEFGIVVISRHNGPSRKALAEDEFYREILPYVTHIKVPTEYKNVSSSGARTVIERMRKDLKTLREILPYNIYEYVKETYL